MGLTTLFNIIHRYHCIISTNFYLYLQYFLQKNSSFSKISGFQIWFFWSKYYFQYSSFFFWGAQKKRFIWNLASVFKPHYDMAGKKNRLILISSSFVWYYHRKKLDFSNSLVRLVLYMRFVIVLSYKLIASWI